MNDRTNNIDEMKLTAYALGELDADDAAEVEKAIENDEALTAEVESIRATAQMLTGELSEEPAPTLTAEQRETLAQEPKKVLNHPSIFTVRTRWAASGLAAAAMITLVIFVPAYWQSLDRQGAMFGDDFAINSAPTTESDALMEASPAPLVTRSFERMDAPGLSVDSSEEVFAKSLADPNQVAVSSEMTERDEIAQLGASRIVDDRQSGLLEEAGLVKEAKLIKDEDVFAKGRIVGQDFDQKKADQPRAEDWPGTSIRKIEAEHAKENTAPIKLPAGKAGQESNEEEKTSVINNGKPDSVAEPQTIGGGKIAGNRNGAPPPPANKPMPIVPGRSEGLANEDGFSPIGMTQNSIDAIAGLVELSKIDFSNAPEIDLSSALNQGGQQENNEFRRREQTPFLGDIPTMGELFRGGDEFDDLLSQFTGEVETRLGIDPSAPRSKGGGGGGAGSGIFDTNSIESQVYREVRLIRRYIAAERRTLDPSRKYEFEENINSRLELLDIFIQNDKDLAHKYGGLTKLYRRRVIARNEAYAPLIDNPWTRPLGEKALSTFSIDVDTASYANMRRFVRQGSLPPRDAVRIEELINYFKYDYEAPTEESEHPFAAHVEIADAPWNDKHRLVRIGLKGREVAMDKRPATNLVFLIDVSGSMQPANKLPLLKQSMKMLVEHLNGDDTIAIVTYAGNSGLVLPATHCDARESILGAIDRLSAGGSTNGGAGIDLAYRLATENFIPKGINRVILATDGDFNVGVTQMSELLTLIENRRKTGVFLSVLGFGEGNIKDDKMELLADKGNGNYAYIDTLKEARKVLVEEATSTLMTIAKDVKIQVEFNPAKVGAYRLIGYANRMLKAKDFNNDRIDAGEIGAGHTVTALYEIVPPGVAIEGDIDTLKYQQPAAEDADADVEEVEVVESDELFTLKIRYKQPEAAESTKFEIPVIDEGGMLDEASDDFRFASAVAAYGMILRNSEYRGSANYEMVCELAGATPDGRIRGASEFLEDFVHYVMTANIELAVANARALLNAELTDIELANLLRSGPTTFAKFERALQRARQIPELTELCDEIEARVTRGSLQQREVMPLKPENNYRAEFIELVRKAAAIGQPRIQPVPMPIPEN